MYIFFKVRFHNDHALDFVMSLALDGKITSGSLAVEARALCLICQASGCMEEARISSQVVCCCSFMICSLDSRDKMVDCSQQTISSFETSTPPMIEVVFLGSKWEWTMLNKCLAVFELLDDWIVGFNVSDKNGFLPVEQVLHLALDLLGTADLRSGVVCFQGLAGNTRHWRHRAQSTARLSQQCCVQAVFICSSLE